jgi:hypothetical protein
MFEPEMWRRPTIIHIPEELMEPEKERRRIEDIMTTAGQPNVTPNPNEDTHSGLKKVVRLLQRSRDELHGMIGTEALLASDPWVKLVVDIAEAQGLVEGYMLGEQWKEKFGL